MASAREIRKKGNALCFCFTAVLGRDADGKQIRKYLTWTPPDGLTTAKAKKLAQREADKWEEKVKQEYEKQKEAEAVEIGRASCRERV